MKPSPSAPPPTEGQLLWGEAKSAIGGRRQAIQALLTAGDRDVRDLETGRVLFRRIFAFAHPYRASLYPGLFIVVLASLVGLASAKMWKFLVDSLVPGGNPDDLTRTTFVLLGLYLASSALGLSSGYLLRLVGLRVTMDLRLKLYKHLQRLSIAFYSDRRTGELVSRIMSDVAAVRSVVSGDMAGLLRQVVLFLGALVMIIIMNWKLTAFMIVIVPVVSTFSIWLGRAMRRLAIQVTDEFAGVTTVLEESISGVRTVRSFGREEYETGRFRQRLARLMAIAVKQMYLEIVFTPVLSFLFFGSTVVIIWFGGKEVLAGRLTPGDLVVFISLTGILGGAIRWVGGLWTRLQSVLGTMDRLFKLLDLQPDITDAPDARVLEDVEGRLTFENVSLKYSTDESARLALRDVTIDVAPGETLAVVGPSGAGKTSLINLVPRFYDPTEGRLMFDGIDIRSVTSLSLRQQIGLVPQETHLFAGTIRDNILYGRLDATEDEMIEAARAANAHDFIAEFPQGYETVVGERGMKVSGGQRQRIAIARALLKDPRVLLLDEATSALDTESERLVQEALDRLMANRTTLVIAHRLSTVKNANRIAVLNEGNLVELGTHEELLAADGLYAMLHQQQFRDEVPEGAELSRA